MWGIFCSRSSKGVCNWVTIDRIHSFIGAWPIWDTLNVEHSVQVVSFSKPSWGGISGMITRE